MVEEKKWKTLNLDSETMQKLTLMSKALNISKAGLNRLVLAELFELFTLYRPFDVNIHFENSVYPMSQLVITFSGKRNLIVGKSSEKRLNETLLKIAGETKHE
jgi:hypothetical protein